MNLTQTEIIILIEILADYRKIISDKRKKYNDFETEMNLRKKTEQIEILIVRIKNETN